MTNEEAKFMLQGYRANGADADNPAFAEALAQAERDPGLRAWFAREQVFDGIVAGKLSAVTAPASLRECIVAGTRLSTISATASPSPQWWQQPWSWGLAAAAAVVLVASLAVLRPAGDQPALVRIEPVLQLAMADIAGSHGPGAHAAALGPFGQWVMNSKTHLQNVETPIDLEALRTKGCRAVSIGGHEVFEVCFKRDGAWFHLYIMPRSSCDPSGLNFDPMFHEQGSFVAASWADEQFAYLVAGATDLPTLRALL